MYRLLYLVFFFAAISIQIQKEQPFFERYENGWPIRSIMQTYMSNSKQAAKKRRAALGTNEDQEENDDEGEDDDDKEDGVG
jgi:methylmalonyl-CoA mutase N-terminal domain/subunit